MTSVVQSTGERSDVRTIVGGGIKLGLVTAVGVVAFALMSRALSGSTETVIQAMVIIVGGVLASYLPAAWVRPRSADAIAWGALVGLLGALVFTVVDTALLRPLHLYHWTWDEIGGGSGFWYVPVWWMGATTLAWLGSWVVANRAPAGWTALVRLAALSVLLALAVFALLVLTDLAPFRSAIMALAFAVAMVMHVPISMLSSRP